MSADIAYVDTSCLVAIAFSEPGFEEVRADLESRSRLVAAGLVEAELRSALAREGRSDASDALLARVRWVHPARRLEAEIQAVLRAGYLRGADAWHLAVALWFAPAPGHLAFYTLDQAQARVASELGFQVLSDARSS